MKAMTVRATSLGIITGLWLLTASGVSGADDGADEGTVEEETAAKSDEAFLNSSGDETANEEATTEDDGAKGEESDTDEDGEKKWGGRMRDHERQGFANILAGTGYFMVAPYDKDDENKRCADNPEEPDRGEAVCSGRSGWHLDMLLGYGLKPGFELFAIFRLGLEQPSGKGLKHQPKVRQLGAGIKIYTPKEGLFKLAFGIAPLFDFSNRGGIDVRPDFVIHVPIAAHFDINPWFGAFAQISPNISFIAEFRLEFTGGIGLQGRFP